MCIIRMKYGFPYVRSNMFQKHGNVKRSGYLSPEIFEKLAYKQILLIITSQL